MGFFSDILRDAHTRPASVPDGGGAEPGRPWATEVGQPLASPVVSPTPDAGLYPSAEFGEGLPGPPESPQSPASLAVPSALDSPGRDEARALHEGLLTVTAPASPSASVSRPEEAARVDAGTTTPEGVTRSLPPGAAEPLGSAAQESPLVPPGPLAPSPAGSADRRGRAPELPIDTGFGATTTPAPSDPTNAGPEAVFKDSGERTEEPREEGWDRAESVPAEAVRAAVVAEEQLASAVSRGFLSGLIAAGRQPLAQSKRPQQAHRPVPRALRDPSTPRARSASDDGLHSPGILPRRPQRRPSQIEPTVPSPAAGPERSGDTPQHSGALPQPRVHIGQVDVVVAAQPRPQTPPAAPPTSGSASRLYLRGL